MRIARGIVVVLLFAATGCHHGDYARTLDRLAARQAAEDVVTALFLATDAKDWARVEALFAPEVRFDMTSLAGGEPAVMTGAAIAAAWEEDMAAVDRIHHQVGNFQTALAEARATVRCHGMATHYREGAEAPVTWFVGDYVYELVLMDGAWRIIAMTYNSKFVR